MYMPNIEEKLNPNPGGIETLISAGEKIPLIQVIGNHGELAYCVQGSLPGTGTISGSVFAGLQPNLSQSDFCFEKQFVQHQNPGNVLVPQLQNRLQSLNSNRNNHSLTQTVDFTSGLGSFSTGIFHSSQVQQYAKPFMLANLQAPSEASSCFSQVAAELNGLKQAGTTPTGTSTVIVKSDGELANASMSSAPGVAAFHTLSKSTVGEKRSLNFKPQVALQEFGPVEKAVFNQAMSTQLKQRLSCSKMEVTSLTTHKTLSDLKFKGGKHSRGMFEQHTARGGNIYGVTSNQSDVTTVTLPLNGSLSNASNVTSLDLAGAKNFNDLKATTRKSLRQVTVPEIRYHPYSKAGEKSEAKKRSDSSVLVKKIYKALNDWDSDKTTDSSSPAAQVHSSQTTSSVFRVSVPRTGSYVLNNPTANTKVTPVRGPTAATIDSKQPEICAPETNEEKCSSGDIKNLKPEYNDDVKDLLQDEIKSKNNVDQAASEPTQKSETPPALTPAPSPPAREVHLPNPLPSYITKVDKPPGRVLKESLHCTTCDVYVNSENQMKQHINSLRHKNTLQGLPTPPKPGREEKPKAKSDQYRCHVCKVTLNSDIQLSQHLASQRHKNMLEGKPPKPRWSPYERTQQTLLHSASALRLPFKTITPQSLLTSAQPPANVVTSSPQAGLPSISGLSALPPGYLNSSGTISGPAQLKQTSIMLHEGGFLQAREIVYVGAPQVPGLQPATAFTTALPTALPGVLSGQQQVQFQPLVSHQPATVDWVTAGGLRLAT